MLSPDKPYNSDNIGKFTNDQLKSMNIRGMMNISIPNEQCGWCNWIEGKQIVFDK